MKSASVSACLLLLLSAVVFADDAPAARSKFTLVRITDSGDKESLQVLDPAALSQLQDEIKVEDRLFDRALAATEKAWKADEFTKSKAFPRSAIIRRSCAVLQTYTTRESADKAMAAAEEKASRAEAAKAEAAKKREENKRKTTGNNPAYTPKKKDPKEDAEKNMLAEQARNMFATKIEELKKARTEPAAPAGADHGADAKAPAGGQPNK